MISQVQSSCIETVVFSREVHLNAIQSKQISCSPTHITIDLGDYKRNHWDEIFPLMKTINALVLLLWHNREPTILKEIAHIGFPLLTNLIVQRNSLRSIEALVKLNASNLVSLCLGNNQIISIKSFRKSNLPSIEVIDLNLNYVRSLQYISEMDATNLKTIVSAVEPFENVVNTLRPRRRQRRVVASQLKVQLRKLHTHHTKFRQMPFRLTQRANQRE